MEGEVQRSTHFVDSNMETRTDGILKKTILEGLFRLRRGAEFSEKVVVYIEP